MQDIFFGSRNLPAVGRTLSYSQETFLLWGGYFLAFKKPSGWGVFGFLVDLPSLPHKSFRGEISFIRKLNFQIAPIVVEILFYCFVILSLSKYKTIKKIATDSGRNHEKKSKMCAPQNNKNF